MSSFAKGITAVLIGAGNIGAGYDAHSPKDRPSLSHLTALQRCKRIKSIEIVDPDESVLRRLEKANKVRHVSTILDPNLIANADLIVVASPTSTHTNVLNFISQHSGPGKNIVCEKPVSASKQDRDLIASLPHDFTEAIHVNYSRRWSLDHSYIKELIDNETFGSLKFVRCVYDKGLLNNGVHLLDYLKTLLGPEIEVRWVGDPVFDSSPNNPTLSLNLKINSIPIFIAGNDSRNYSLFEVKFFFETATFELKDSGRQLIHEQTTKHRLYRDYTILEQLNERPTDLINSLDAMYQSILSKSCISNFQEAISTEQFCSQIIESFMEPRN